MRTIQLDSDTLEPAASLALVALDKHVRGLGLDKKLLELVKVRSSQLNGCAFCTDMHSTDALKAGVSQRQLLSLTVWRESAPLFSDTERSLLAFTEAATLLSGGVSDEVIAGMQKHFTDAEIVRWTMAVIAINAWNRLGVVTGLVPEV